MPKHRADEVEEGPPASTSKKKKAKRVPRGNPSEYEVDTFKSALIDLYEMDGNEAYAKARSKTRMRLSPPSKPFHCDEFMTYAPESLYAARPAWLRISIGLMYSKYSVDLCRRVWMAMLAGGADRQICAEPGRSTPLGRAGGLDRMFQDMIVHLLLKMDSLTNSVGYISGADVLVARGYWERASIFLDLIFENTSIQHIWSTDTSGCRIGCLVSSLAPMIGICRSHIQGPVDWVMTRLIHQATYTGLGVRCAPPRFIENESGLGTQTMWRCLINFGMYRSCHAMVSIMRIDDIFEIEEGWLVQGIHKRPECVFSTNPGRCHCHLSIESVFGDRGETLYTHEPIPITRVCAHLVRTAFLRLRAKLLPQLREYIGARMLIDLVAVIAEYLVVKDLSIVRQ